MFCVLFFLALASLSAFTVREIPVTEIESIALRNAQAFWGKVNPGQPIPVYDLYDQLIAWQFNFALSKPFPAEDELLGRIKAEGSNLYYAEWDEAEFANILMGARTDMPVVIAYSNGLSEHYFNYVKVDELTREGFAADYKLIKDVYVSLGWEWVVVASGADIRYVKASPPFMVCTREEFLERSTSKHYPQKHEDFSEEWQASMEGETMDRSYIFVQNSNLIPFISYSFGCSPTSGAILNEYYKNNSPNMNGHYTKLLSHYYKRYDAVSTSWRYHVSDAHDEIATYMDTDAEVFGLTWPWDVASGMGDYYEERDHEYWGDYYSWYWDYMWSNSYMYDDLKHEINRNFPALMNTYNHTICAIGYSNSSSHVALHDPNRAFIRYWSISDFWYLMKIHPRPQAEGASVNLLYPDGGQEFLANGQGEILQQNAVYDIRWESELIPDSYVDIYYGTDAAHPMQGMVPITTGYPNSGFCPWLVPGGLESETMRVMIQVKNASGQHLGYDASWGQFSVRPGGSVPQLVNTQVISVSDSLIYRRFDTPANMQTWVVVGLRGVNGTSSGMSLWDQGFTTQKVSSTVNDKLNWVVVDKHHAPETQMGLRISLDDPSQAVALEFEGGVQSMNTGSNSLSWTSGEVVRMYDIALEPGINTFSLNHSSGYGNMGIALYGAQGAMYLPKSAYLGYSDDNTSMGTESFSVWISEADIYGLVIWANTASAYGGMTVNIGGSGQWTGAVSTAWNLGANWVAGHAPTMFDNVFIPASVSRKPVINGGITAICRDLIIAEGSRLTIGDGGLHVAGTANIYGMFRTEGSSSVTFWGNVIWHSSAELEDQAASEFQATRDWRVNQSASVLMNHSSLRFAGNSNTVMNILSSETFFKNLIINKAAAYTVGVNAPFYLEVGNLSVLTTLSFLGSTSLSILETLNSSGNLSFQTGNLAFDGTATKTISCAQADKFYNISFSGNVNVITSLRASGSITLASGVLNLGTNTLSIGRNLTRQSGSIADTAYRISFIGAAHSNLGVSHIPSLEVAKYSNGELIVTSGNSFSCDSYDWTSGSIRVLQGASFIVDDLADSCIKGGFYLEDGTIELHQDAYHGVDLDADVYIYGGNFNIYGGYNWPSEWAYTHSVTLHMEGGVLDFKDRGILLQSTGHYLNAVISGGTIRTPGDFIVERSGFIPTGGTIELYGSGTAYAKFIEPSAAYNLAVLKSGRARELSLTPAPSAKRIMQQEDQDSEPDPRINQVVFNSSSKISNNLSVSSGLLKVSSCTLTIGKDLDIFGSCNLSNASDRIVVGENLKWHNGSSGSITNGSITLGKNWSYDSGSTASVSVPANVTFTGSMDSTIFAMQGTSIGLGNLTISKNGASCQVSSSSPAAQISLGTLTINSGSTFYPGNKIYNLSGRAMVREGGALLLQSGVINTPEYSQTGILNLISGELNVSGNFTQNQGSSSQISGGTINLPEAYGGVYNEFAGTVSMSGGLINIPQNGMVIGNSAFSMTGGYIKLGFIFAAPSPNTFLASGGTVEFVGNESQTNLAAGNYFPNLIVNLTTGTVLQANSDLLVKKNCLIQNGRLDIQEYKLSINGNLRIAETGYLWADDANAEIWLKGNWANEGTSQNFSAGSGMVVMFANSSYIQSSETFFKLRIIPDAGRTITLNSNYTVTVNNNLEISSGVFKCSQNSTLNVHGNVSVEDATLYMLAYPGVGNHLAIDGTLSLSSGTLTAQQTEIVLLGALITNSSSRIETQAVTFTNSAPGTWQLINCDWSVLDQSSIVFQNKGIQLVAGSQIFLEYLSSFRTGKNFYATALGLMGNWYGATEFIGSAPSSIVLSADNQLYDLIVNKTGATVSLSDDVVIRGKLSIESGTFNSGGNTIELQGIWDNEVGQGGYVHANSEIIFSYQLPLGLNNYQSVTGSQSFYNVTIDHQTNSTFTKFESLLGSSILGNLEILQGGLIHEGDLQVHKNIHIAEGCYMLISSGNLCLYGNLIDENPLQVNTPELKAGCLFSVNSYFHLKGNTDQYLTVNAPSFHVPGIVIDKSAAAFKPNNPMVVEAQVTVQRGTWAYQTPGLSHVFNGSLEIAANGIWADNTGIVTFGGDTSVCEVKINGNVSFHHIVIDKDLAAGGVYLLATNWNTGSNQDFIVQSGLFQINGRNFQTGGGITVMNGGKLSLLNNASVTMHTSTILDIQSGGILESLGSETQKALFTNLNGMNEFYIQSGATISAENTIFEKVGYDGVYVMNGAFVNPAHCFTNCEFRYGFMFGNLLTINNDQHLTIQNPVFISSAAPWGSQYNVLKDGDWGSLTINGESGAFSGYEYEWDPFSRINWSTDVPGFWASTSDIAFGEVTWGMQTFQYLDILNTGSASLSGSIIVPEGFSAEPYGRIDVATQGRVMLHSAKTDLPQHSLREGTLDLQLSPGSGITYKVSFFPELPGAYDADMIFQHNAPGALDTVHLSGFARGATIQASPEAFVFELLPGGVDTKMLSITNTGNDSLSYYATVSYGRNRHVNSILSEGFEGAFPPMYWYEEHVSGTSPLPDWNISSTSVHPSGTAPHGGNQLAYFNSYNCYADAQSRLVSQFFSLTGADPAELSFWMYHDMGYNIKMDRIQVQISTDGISWTDLGAPINRYAGETGWAEHVISLSSYSGMPNLFIGLLGISEYGNDIHIDDFHIYTIPPPTGWVSLDGGTDIMGSLFPEDDPATIEVQVNGTALPAGSYGASIYIYSNDYLNWSTCIPLSLIVGNPEVSFSEPYLAWGPTRVGLSGAKYISIQNLGSISLEASITVSGGFEFVDPLLPRRDAESHSDPGSATPASARGYKNKDSQESNLALNQFLSHRNPLEVSIPAGSIYGLLVAFAPTAVQDYEGTLLVSSNAGADASIALYGTGIDYPSVSTLSVDQITSQSAICHATVLSNGGSILMERGFCFNESGNPTIEDARVIDEDFEDDYSSPLYTLNHSTQYYVRAYAKNSIGVAYGTELSFTTFGPTVYLSTDSLPDFGLIALETGSEEASFTISAEHLLMNIWLAVDENSGFAMSLTADRSQREYVNALELVPSSGSIAETTIYVQFCPADTGYVETSINGQSAGLSEPICISLSGTGICMAQVLNGIPFDISQSTAIGSGLVINDGLAPILSMGICWSEEPAPDLLDFTAAIDFQEGWFYCQMEDLEPNTQCFYRAFATNQAGTAYSEGESFITSITPQIFLDERDFQAFGAMEAGMVSDADTLFVSGLGLDFSLTIQVPDGFQISDTLEPEGISFASELTLHPSSGTIPETPVYIRFAPEEVGDYSDFLICSSEGAEILEFLLTGIATGLAELTTKPISEITSTSASSGGLITSSGFSPSEAAGICWSTEPNPSLEDSFTSEYVEPDFVSQLADLQSNIPYYVRAYVTNSVGTAYGNELSFTTQVSALDAPQNLHLSFTESNVLLAWDAVDNALSYIIYRSGDPYAEDWGDPIAITGSTSWIDLDSADQYFYKVSASTQAPNP